MKQFLSNGTKTMEVVGCYNYTYNYGRGKEVLRVSFDSDKYDFQSCLDFITNRQEFTQYETMDDSVTDIKEMKMVNKYTYFLRDISSTYSQADHKFEFEVNRIDDVERATANNSKDIMDLAEMITLMYEASL